jgi:hypothetical protein
MTDELAAAIPTPTINTLGDVLPEDSRRGE